MPTKHAHSHRPTKTAPSQWKEKPGSVVSPAIQNALKDAMRTEGIPDTDFNDLLWIMAQESAGVVDVRNGTSTARGLFQLLRAQYSLNPCGEASFGNAKEECQGGIRYIYGRYHSAHMARAFWQQHHWY
ncbi:hypothetical protein LJ655_13600 [Paraburkholderia sp. MMS20-SJTN17]|uniref:Transglycosylase SLT domain-containing protein n=1 Tax=Paraburkholderia translucens TaxID=2886945 RepID=A0ABS8KDR2_9BURK|nr:hypothetical protein [Paraburkholderia sp. MMS20-SJTN17]MCC8402907.1 hypothetical protein [Paraburkholderia sp. MMS20-SJTN17]